MKIHKYKPKPIQKQNAVVFVINLCSFAGWNGLLQLLIYPNF